MLSEQLQWTITAHRRRTLRRYLPRGATTSANIAALNKVILPVIRRVMPSIIASQIIGCAPMVGPVTSIATLRTRYREQIKTVQMRYAELKERLLKEPVKLP